MMKNIPEDINKLSFEDIGVNIDFSENSKIYISKYNLSQGFNKTKLAYKINVEFNKELETAIQL